MPMAIFKPKAPDAPANGKELPPSPLTTAQKCLAALLMIAGAVLIWAVLDIFLTGGEWLVEDTVTSGEGAEKTVTTKKYSDALPLAALGIGALLILCGAFYGRLRKVTLPGGGGLEFAEAAAKVEKDAEQLAKEKVKDGAVPEEKAEEFVQLVTTTALADLMKQVTTHRVAAPPAERELGRIVDRAVSSAEKLV